MEEITKDWEEKRLTEFIWFQRGYDLPKKNFKNGVIPVYGSTSILGYHDTAKVKGPGIVTGRSGTLGYFQYAENDFWPHNTTLWVKDFKGNNTKFAYYLLQTLDFTIFNSGGAVPTLNRNLLNAYIVNIPPLATQQKIASVLSAYDDLIENNLKRIEVLEEMAQQTYEEWFVRMKYPGHETDQLNPETGLPEGWEEENLFDFSEVLFGYPFKAKDFNNEKLGTPIVRIRNIPNSSTDDYTTEIVDDKYLLKNGDILIGMDGEFYINVWTGGRAYLVQRSCCLRAKNKSLQGYLLQAIRKPIFIFQNSIDGATVAHLGKKHLEKIYIAIPKPIIEKLSFFNEINNTIINLSQQNQHLLEARDLLLPRLMMGLIDVEEILVHDEVYSENGSIK